MSSPVEEILFGIPFLHKIFEKWNRSLGKDHHKPLGRSSMSLN